MMAARPWLGYIVGGALGGALVAVVQAAWF
jgi:hypothetical protein